MVELTGFDKALFDVKRKKVNEYIKRLVKDGRLEGRNDKIQKALEYFETYLNAYLKLCQSEEDVMDLVNKVPILRKERLKLRRKIAAEAYAYGSTD